MQGTSVIRDNRHDHYVACDRSSIGKGARSD